MASCSKAIALLAPFHIQDREHLLQSTRLSGTFLLGQSLPLYHLVLSKRIEHNLQTINTSHVKIEIVAYCNSSGKSFAKERDPHNPSSSEDHIRTPPSFVYQIAQERCCVRTILDPPLSWHRTSPVVGIPISYLGYATGGAMSKVPKINHSSG